MCYEIVWGHLITNTIMVITLTEILYSHTTLFLQSIPHCIPAIVISYYKLTYLCSFFVFVDWFIWTSFWKLQSGNVIMSVSCSGVQFGLPTIESGGNGLLVPGAGSEGYDFMEPFLCPTVDHLRQLGSCVSFFCSQGSLIVVNITIQEHLHGAPCRARWMVVHGASMQTG